ncbi:unnamed protein product, partial [Staurois parvus]
SRDQLCPHSGSAIHRKSRRCRLGHVISGFQSQLITCKQGNAGYRHLSPQRWSAHQCHINATYQCPSELHFSVTHQCQSVQPINASQCRLTVPYE